MTTPEPDPHALGPDGVTCETCRFWDPSVGMEHYGICRRYAPSPRLTKGLERPPTVTWPESHSTDWCGEWEGHSFVRKR